MGYLSFTFEQNSFANGLGVAGMALVRCWFESYWVGVASGSLGLGFNVTCVGFGLLWVGSGVV